MRTPQLPIQNFRHCGIVIVGTCFEVENELPVLPQEILCGIKYICRRCGEAFPDAFYILPAASNIVSSKASPAGRYLRRNYFRK